jgi:hypothetical protein
MAKEGCLVEVDGATFREQEDAQGHYHLVLRQVVVSHVMGRTASTSCG